MAMFIKTELPDSDECEINYQETQENHVKFNSDVNFVSIFVKQEKDECQNLRETNKLNLEKCINDIDKNCNNTENNKFIRVRNDVFDTVKEKPNSTNDNLNDSGYGNDNELETESNNETFELRLDENYSEAKGGRYLICTAKNCRNNNNIRKDLYYFKFPRDPTVCAIWIKNCNRLDLVNKKTDFCHVNYRLCSVHFEKTMFADGKLLVNAVPTIFTKENIPKIEDNRLFTNNSESESNYRLPNPLFPAAPVHRNYICYVCQKGFTTKYSLTLHERIHSNERPYECPKCNKNFHQTANLKTHMLTHTQEKKFECDICKKKFSQRCHLTKHKQIHERERLLKSYREFLKSNSISMEIQDRKDENNCIGEIKHEIDEECSSQDGVSDVKIKTEPDDNIEENDYDPLQQQLDEEEDEDDEDENQSDLLIPIEQQNNENLYFSSRHSGKNVKDSPFKCSVCNRCYVNEYSLKVHERIHTGIRPFSCHLCKKEFFQSSNLKTHLAKHNSEKKFQCQVCNKRFMFDFDLKHHETCHDKEKALECIVCHKTFSHRGNLLKHEKIHTGVKRYQCPECDKQFYDGSDLRKHLLVHSDEKPFECRICNKKFSRHTYLKGHMSIHTNDQSFQCDECFKVFSTRALLKRHIQRHRAREDGIKPYYCEICDLFFSQTCSLKKHRKTPKHIQLLQSKKNDCNDNSNLDMSVNSDSKSLTNIFTSKKEIFSQKSNFISLSTSETKPKDLELSLALSKAMSTNIIASNVYKNEPIQKNDIIDYIETKPKNFPKLLNTPSSNIIMISDKTKLNIEKSSLLSSGVDIISTATLKDERVFDDCLPSTSKFGQCIKYFPSGVEIYKL